MKRQYGSLDVLHWVNEDDDDPDPLPSVASFHGWIQKCSGCTPPARVRGCLDWKKGWCFYCFDTPLLIMFQDVFPQGLFNIHTLCEYVYIYICIQYNIYIYIIYIIYIYIYVHNIICIYI